MNRLEKIKQSFKSAKRKIRVAFYRYEWKEILIFLFFVLLSFGFWILQSLQEDYEIQLDIPVRYRNMPRDIAFVQTPPEEITARVRDKGSTLLNYTLGRKITSININMKDITSQSGTLSLSNRDIEGYIMRQLIPTTSLVSFSPQQIEEPYSKLVNKNLPVVFEGDIRTEPGFRVSGDPVINPPTVSVYASDMVLDTLKSIKTVYTEIRKGSKSINRSVQLQKTSGTSIDPPTVSVSIPIEEYTEKTLDIPIISRGVPQQYTIRMFPSTVKLSFSVPLSRFREISENEFAVEAPVTSPDQNISGMLPVKLTKKPDWVDKVVITPDSIEFILEQIHTDD